MEPKEIKKSKIEKSESPFSYSCMLDTETYGFDNNAFVFEISAVVFDHRAKSLVECDMEFIKLYINLPFDDLKKITESGYTYDESVRDFWDEPANQNVLNEYKQHEKIGMKEALIKLSDFLSKFEIKEFFAKPSCFDFPKLENAYKVEGIVKKIPWKHYQRCCSRTIYNLNLKYFGTVKNYKEKVRIEIFKFWEKYKKTHDTPILMIDHEPLYDCFKQIYDVLLFNNNQGNLFEEKKNEIENNNSNVNFRINNSENRNEKPSETGFLLVKKLSEHARTPEKKTSGSAGYDLYSARTTVIPPRNKEIVKTDISISIPKGYYAKVASRSSLSKDFSIEVGAGTIDQDYRGDIRVVLYNHGDIDYRIEKGDRIAQLILHKIITPEITEVNDLDKTERGENGFGSTGLRN